MTIEEFYLHYKKGEADFENFNVLKLCNKLKIDYVKSYIYTYILLFDDGIIRVQQDWKTKKTIIDPCSWINYPRSDLLRTIDLSINRIIKEEKDVKYRKENLKRSKRYLKNLIAFKEKHNIKEEE